MSKHTVRFSVARNPFGALVTGSVVVALSAACSFPQQRTGLCYSPAGATSGWVTGGEGRLGTTLAGASVVLDLGSTQTLVEVSVQNSTGKPIELRMGAEGTAPSLQIGELLRRILRDAGASGSDYEPYNAMQAVTVESGWRASFYLDSPLGREPTYGQYFVFTVEARLPSGAVDRRSLPLVAVTPRASSSRR